MTRFIYITHSMQKKRKEKKSIICRGCKNHCFWFKKFISNR